MSWTNKFGFFITLEKENYVAKALDVQTNQFEEVCDESFSLISYDSMDLVEDSSQLFNSIQSFN